MMFFLWFGFGELSQAKLFRLVMRIGWELDRMCMYFVWFFDDFQWFSLFILHHKTWCCPILLLFPFRPYLRYWFIPTSWFDRLVNVHVGKACFPKWVDEAPQLPKWGWHYSPPPVLPSTYRGDIPRAHRLWTPCFCRFGDCCGCSLHKSGIVIVGYLMVGDLQLEPISFGRFLYLSHDISIISVMNSYEFMWTLVLWIMECSSWIIWLIKNIKGKTVQKGGVIVIGSQASF